MKEEKKILLIHKVLTGVATQEELELYGILKNQSAEDKQLVDDISYIWGISKSNNKAFDKAKAKARLFNRIEEQSEQDIDKVSKVKIFNIQKVMSIAAVFVFLIAAIFVLQKFTKRGLTGVGEVSTNLRVLPTVDNDNSTKLYRLSDKTKVWVDNNSTVSIAEVSGKNKREVNLVGNAFFEVSKDKSHPFVVNVKGFKVKVLGTSFQIFSNDNIVEVDVYSGIVSFASSDKREILLKKGEGAIFDEKKNDFVGITKESFKTNTKDMYLVFSDESLKTVFAKLSNYFEVEISFDCETIETMGGYTSPQFAGDNIEYYFSTIEKLYDLSIVKSGNREYSVKCD